MPPPADAIRFGAPQSVILLLGLLLLAASAVMMAVAVRAQGGGWVGLPFALGMVVFLPQFFGPPLVRIAHGLLLLVGCVLLARWIALLKDRRLPTQRDFEGAPGAGSAS